LGGVGGIRVVYLSGERGLDGDGCSVGICCGMWMAGGEWMGQYRGGYMYIHAAVLGPNLSVQASSYTVLDTTWYR